MTIKAFAEEIKNKLESTLMFGYAVDIEERLKNNDTRLTSIVIRKNGSSISPAIYIDNLYTSYQNGMSIDEICRALIRLYNSSGTLDDFDGAVVTDFDRAKDKIGFKLVNAERNKEYLKDVPFVPYLDLAVIFYLLISTERDDSGIIVIKNEFLDAWNVDTETLYKQALENMPHMLRGRIDNMSDMMCELMTGCQAPKNTEGEFDMPEALDDSALPMFIATNSRKVNGASIILYPGLLKTFAEFTGSDLYIFPSSVHEVILHVPDNVLKVESMKEMVQEVNASEVTAEDFLSDNIYFYSRERDQVELAK